MEDEGGRQGENPPWKGLRRGAAGGEDVARREVRHPSRPRLQGPDR